jgi:hypothetical protein
MAGRETRRTVLGRAGLVLGAAGFGTIFGNAASRARAASGASTGDVGAAVVSEVRDGTVRVDGKITGWFRIEGFPEGWQVAAGDQVTVAPSLETTGLSAYPRAHWVPATAAPADLELGARISHDNGPEIVAATVLDAGLIAQRRVGDRGSRPLMVAVADHLPSQGTERALTIRRVA